jgi:hypothetical protein
VLRADRPSVASRGRLPAAAVLATLALAAIGVAAAGARGGTMLRDTTRTVTLHATRTVTLHAPPTVKLPAGTVADYFIGYPDALKYGNATYRGSYRVLGPLPGAAGRTPSLRRVKVLSSGSALGGSDYMVRVRNANPPGTAAVRVAITAATTEPAGR